MMRLRRLDVATLNLLKYSLPLAVVWTFALPAFAERGAAVLGSWQNEIFAQRAKQRLDDQLRLQTRLLPVTVQGTLYYRVISQVRPEADIRQLLEEAEALGYKGWFLTETALASLETIEPGPIAGTPPASVEGSASAAGPRQLAAATGGMTPIAGRGAERPATLNALTSAVEVGAAKGTTMTDASVASTTDKAGLAGTDDGRLPVPYSESPNIEIDGDVTEAEWLRHPGIDEMVVTEPDTADKPDYKTVSRFIYTDKGLYVSAVMTQPRETIVDRLSARDQSLNRDSFMITLDPSGEGLYGYWFEVSAGGTVLDGKVVPERAFSEQWDGPWQGAASITENGWSAELYLPWSMMAMPQSDARKMGFWLRRKVAHLDETYSWPHLPFRAPKFMTALKPMSLPGVEPKQSVAFFPYVSATLDEIREEQDYEAGVDFSYRPSSNLQITGTVNPDFGAVESDDVVVNLTAFETFFPEKRLFFLEGNEVFETSPRSDLNRFNSRPLGTGPRATPSTFENEPTTLVNTRRIGGAATRVEIPDGVSIDGVERSKPTDLLGAVKVVGQTGKLRYGVLSAFEDDVELRGTDDATGADVTVTAPGRDFGVVRAIYEDVGRGRRSIGYLGTLVTLPDDDSIVHGVDTHLLSADGKWRYDGQYIYSEVDGVDGHGYFADVNYVPNRNWFFRGAVDWLDEELDVSDLGFIRRNDIVTGRLGAIRRQARGMKRFREMRNSLFFSMQTNNQGFANRVGIYSNQTFGFFNRSEVKWTLNYFPSHWDDRQSRGNGWYKTEDRWFTQLAYGSDTARPFSWSGTLTAEQEQLGGWTYGSDLGFTYTPSGRFTLDFDMRYKKRDGWLIYRSGPDFTTYETTDLQPTLSTDFFFNARHQLRLTMQWAGIKARDQEYLTVPLSEGPLIPRGVQPSDGSEDFTISRLTAQLRYRWEIGPLSDLFVVYTRGSNLPNQAIETGFDDLLVDALSEPIVDVFVVKLRYRFGL